MKLMLFAAGEGTRLRPYTLETPKPAIPFLGIPLATYSVELFQELSPSELVINTFHLTEKIHMLFNQNQFSKFEKNFSDEKDFIRGSGGGLFLTQKFLSGEDHFLACNADEVILPLKPHQLQQALKEHKENDRLATLIVMEDPRVGTQFGGVWADEKNSVLGFGKIPAAGAQKGWHFIGAFIFSKRIFEYIPDDQCSNILYDTLTSAIAKGEKVGVFNLHCLWFETGNPNDFNEATRHCHALSQGNFELFKDKKLPEAELTFASQFLNQILAKSKSTSNKATADKSTQLTNVDNYLLK